MPLLAEINKRTRYQVHLVRMPLDLAVLNANAAAAIIKDNGRITDWVLAGHSLGGVMAASYAADNPSAWKALILLAAYPDQKKPLRTGRVLSISASEDGLSTPQEIRNSAHFLPADTFFLEIAGGNHAQFGSYGKQKGDGEALITPERQRDLIVEGIAGFLLSY